MHVILDRFHIGAKITGVVLVVLILAAVVGGTGLVYLGQMNARLNTLVESSAEKVRLAGVVNGAMIEVVRAEKNLLLATSDADRQRYITAADSLVSQIDNQLAILRNLVDPAGAILLSHVTEHWQAYLVQHQQVRELVAAGRTAEAVSLSQGAARNAIDQAQADMAALMNKNDADMTADQLTSNRNFTRARNLMLAVTVVAVVAGLALGLAVAGSIAANLGVMVTVAGEISGGQVDQTLTITSRDETGDLAAAFRQMIAYLKEITAVAGQVSRGNLAVEVSPRSDQDVLGHAIRQMVADLRRVTAENERQLWHSTGQAALSDQMRGELPLPDLARNIITFLCHTVDAQLGAIYLREQETLTLVGSYAYTRRKSLSQQFALGEGLVGQAALEKQMILVSRLPDDYVRIQSGLGESRPQHLLELPFLFEGQVLGVIELASFAGWNDAQTAFLESVAENVGIGLSVAIARTRMAELLEETQRQAEELQAQTEELEAQQEELRQTNEELEEQAQSLRESEQRLQAQQEELRATNEELSEKTKLLERQRAAVERQNQELHAAQEELQHRAEDLAVASKYKSEFLSNMSHELRTPLNSMLILARMLMENENGNLTEKQVESATVIYDSGYDLLALINDILDLAKVEAGRMERHLEPVSLADLLKTIEREFTPLAVEKKLAFETALDPDLPASIESDRKRLMQIMKNLLSNAFKFTPAGSVRVRIHRPEPGVDLTRSRLDPGEAVAISVSDTGIGIAPEQHRVVFEAFQQADGSTSRQYGGTGLGLSISRELAGFLSGEIGLQSALGQGSTFTLYLPEALPEPEPLLLAPEPAAEGAAAPEPLLPAPAPAGARPAAPAAQTRLVPDDRETLKEGDRVLLLVDDDPRFAKTLVDFGHRKGFKCLAAGSGEDALRLARRHRPAAILLDLKLPGISGWDVLNDLKEDPDLRHIPVHIISVEAESLEAARHGAMGYLTKPVELAALENAFQSINLFIDRPIKTLLIVEDDMATRRGLRSLIGDSDVECVEAETAGAALEILRQRPVDCLILDLRLPDMTGFEFLDRLAQDGIAARPPVIVYTGKDLSREENDRLMQYADTVIIKGIKSEERLLDETALFLHRVVADLPPGKQQVIRQLHDKELAMAGKKILLADDDVRNSFALSSLLAQKGLEVEMVTNGQKALDFLAANPNVDLVLMDVMMPVLDGFEAIRRLRSQPRFHRLPILALTAKAMKGDREKCLAAGANDYLSKPIDVDRLFSMLRVWLYR